MQAPPWLQSQLERVAYDSATSDDVKSLWHELYILLESQWVSTVAPETYAPWLTKYANLRTRTHFRSDYILSIMDIP
jgi:hypothetical protein